MTLLPYGRHCIDEDDVAAVVRVLRGDSLTTGPAVASFERALGAATGAPFATACANGTAALHLAMLALGVGPGDLAVVPAITFTATANAARYVGAEVAFADVDPDTGLMTEATLGEAIARSGRSPRLVAPVHYAGQAAAMEALAARARAAGALVVEDACHALGTAGEDWRAGDCRHADATCFSFHPVKTVAMGEGGAVTTRDPDLHRRLQRLRSHGIVREGFVNDDLAFDSRGEPAPWYYEQVELGFNYRACDLQCALGESQLGKLPAFAARRRALADRYDRLLAPLAPMVRPLGRLPGQAPVWHLYVALIDFDALGRERAAVMAALRERGIGSQVHYIPVYHQPYYRERYGRQSLPGAERFYRRCLSLPLFPAMADADVDRVVAALRDVLGERA